MVGLFVWQHMDGDHGVAPADQSSQGQRGLLGGGGHHGDHRGIARELAGRLDQQLGECQSIGQFRAGQRLLDAGELLRPPPCRDDDRSQPVAAAGPLGDLAGERPGAKLPRVALFADAVGRIAGVGHQPHLPAQQADRIRQRGDRGDRQFRAVGLFSRGILVAVEVEYQRHPHHA